MTVAALFELRFLRSEFYCIRNLGVLATAGIWYWDTMNACSVYVNSVRLKQEGYVVFLYEMQWVFLFCFCFLMMRSHPLTYILNPQQ